MLVGHAGDVEKKKHPHAFTIGPNKQAVVVDAKVTAIDQNIPAEAKAHAMEASQNRREVEEYHMKNESLEKANGKAPLTRRTLFGIGF